ncbi:MAG: endonuclease/exonuclease/phosphatase family protein [Streptococcaceae bacterium]|jgi:endonuclease/exonuclease/phosphatase family metal-dependent hydrolase|nr:endonuclease/exonuclease/phosphatase family protein [Streptococcaceae bacterium]
MKKFIKSIVLLFALVVLIAGVYVAYVYIQYHRIADAQKQTVTSNRATELTTGKTYKLMTYNIGYGSYPADYTFFMDGGKEVRARSVQAVNDAIDEDARMIRSQAPDFVTVQEIDWQGTRSQYVNEPARLRSKVGDYGSVLTQNYDSAWLQYPVLDPIGKAKSGILTLSKYNISASTRYSLPIDTNFSKFFDLDRAFDVNILPIASSTKKFVLINTHLSAYTKNVAVQKAQLKKIFDTMQTYVDAGDYVICGGDYNHDLVGRPKNELTWMKSFPTADLTKGMRVVAPNPDSSAPSVRSNGVTLSDPKEIFGWIDGFLVSENVTSLSVKTVSNNFKSSDHQPVVMDFKLK